MTEIFSGPINPELRDFIASIRKNLEEAAAEQNDSDAVNHPDHYQSPATCSECGHHIEAIDVVRHMTFDCGNAVKYIWRAGIKDPDTEIEDLEKAIWYLQDRVNQLKKDQESNES